MPLLLVRGEDAEVRGFLNICRHRGGRVASGRGRPGRAFKCPYHSWAYDLNGELLGQPLARDAFEGLDRAELGLLPVPVAERFGVIFAQDSASNAPIDVEAELAGLGPELAAFKLDEFRFFEERSGVFDANWKLIHDTFLESYHVFSLHRDTIAGDLLSTPFVGDLVRRPRPRRGDAQGGHEAARARRVTVGPARERLDRVPDLPERADQPADERPRRAVGDVPRARRPAPHARDGPVLLPGRAALRRGARVLGTNVKFTTPGRVQGGLRPAAGHPPLAANRADARGDLRPQRADA